MWFTMYRGFLDAIASLDFGYESKSERIIKANTDSSSKHRAIMDVFQCSMSKIEQYCETLSTIMHQATLSKI